MNPSARAHLNARLLSAALAALLLCPFAAAQSGEALRAKKRFLEGLTAPLAADRVKTVEALVATKWPEAMVWMQQALDRTLKSRDRYLEQDEGLAAKIGEITAAYREIDRETRLAKIAAIRKERQQVQAALKRDELVMLALREGMGRLLAKQPPEKQAKTIKSLIRRLKRTRKPEERAALTETLGYLRGSHARDALTALLKAKEPEVRIAALGALGLHRDPTAARATSGCLRDGFWQVRVAAIQALAAMGGRDAVEALMVALGRSEGRILDDLVGALTRLTGQNFHDNQALWRRWWSRNKAGYKGPPVAKAGASTEESEGQKKRAGPDRPKGKGWKNRTEGTAFYGIRTRSKRLVYVLDMSGSMLMKLGAANTRQTGRAGMGAIGERKFDQALNELRTSITALTEDATFNLVFYNTKITVWAKGQVKATPENKNKAMEWAESTVAGGGTNIFDALERAFRLAGRGTFDKNYAIAADTFYLLSDGQANVGRFTTGDDMRREVARLNKFQKVAIHTIALGSDANIPFMQGLAKDTGGQFVHFGVRGRNR